MAAMKISQEKLNVLCVMPSLMLCVVSLMKWHTKHCTVPSEKLTCITRPFFPGAH